MGQRFFEKGEVLIKASSIRHTDIDTALDGSTVGSGGAAKSGTVCRKEMMP